MTAFHYFGSTAYNWATGATRAEVLAKLGRRTGADLLKQHAKAHGGLYVWTCRVPLPADASYDIQNFAPVVPYEAVREFRLQSIKGHSLPIDREDETQC